MKQLLILLFATILISCMASEKSGGKSASNNVKSTMVDARDNQKYEIVKIGNQWWMAQNLNYETTGSYVYNNSSRYASTNGRLYTWEAAKNACPAGWTLPTDEDWMTLETSLGLPERLLDETDFRGSDQGKQLMKKGNSGFNATLGGFRSVDGQYDEMGIVATYWTATQQTKFDAWGRGVQAENNQISRRTFAKDYSFSIRCVKNE
jgi:uncharacterized protein (TIGR02145 family)